MLCVAKGIVTITTEGADNGEVHRGVPCHLLFDI